MQVTVNTALSFEAIPPRCRKARYVSREFQSTVQVPEVTSAQAPLAFIVNDADELPTQEFRFFDGAVFVKHLPWSGQTEDSLPGSKHFPTTSLIHYVNVKPGTGTYDEVVARAEVLGAEQIAERWSAYLIIDGVVWVRAEEPKYAVMTFGFGHNHGGTGLLVTEHINSNVREDAYFPANEFALAQMAAMDVAAKRGDTESVEHISAMSAPIQVLLPEAVTFSVAPVQSSFLAEGHEVGARIPEYGPLTLSDLPEESLFQELRNNDLANNPLNWLRWDAAVAKVRAGQVTEELIERYQAHTGATSAIVTYLEANR